MGQQEELRESKAQIAALSYLEQLRAVEMLKMKGRVQQVQGELHRQTVNNGRWRSTMDEDLKTRDSEKRILQQEVQRLEEGWRNAERVVYNALKDKDKELEKLKRELKAECDEKDRLQGELDLLEERCSVKSQEIDHLQLDLHEACRQIKAGAVQRGNESLQETSRNLEPSGSWVPSGNSILPSGNSVPPSGNQDLALPLEAGLPAPTSGLSFEMGHGTTEMRHLLQSLCIGLEKWSEKMISQGTVGLGASQKHLSLEDCHVQVALAELDSGSLGPQLLQHHTLHLLFDDESSHVKVEELLQAQDSTRQFLTMEFVCSIISELESRFSFHFPNWSPESSARKECEKGVLAAVDIAKQLHAMMSRSKHPLKTYCSIPGERLSTTKHGTPLRMLTTTSWSPVPHATGISQGSWVVVDVGPDQSKDMKEDTCRSEDCFVCLTVTPGIEFSNRQDAGGAVLVPEEVFVAVPYPKQKTAILYNRRYVIMHENYLHQAVPYPKQRTAILYTRRSPVEIGDAALHFADGQRTLLKGF
eukprot:gene30759-35797_t